MQEKHNHSRNIIIAVKSLARKLPGSKNLRWKAAAKMLKDDSGRVSIVQQYKNYREENPSIENIDTLAITAAMDLELAIGGINKEEDFARLKKLKANLRDRLKGNTEAYYFQTLVNILQLWDDKNARKILPIGISLAKNLSSFIKEDVASATHKKELLKQLTGLLHTLENLVKNSTNDIFDANKVMQAMACLLAIVEKYRKHDYYIAKKDSGDDLGYRDATSLRKYPRTKDAPKKNHEILLNEYQGAILYRYLAQEVFAVNKVSLDEDAPKVVVIDGEPLIFPDTYCTEVEFFNNFTSIQDSSGIDFVDHQAHGAVGFSIVAGDIRHSRFDSKNRTYIIDDQIYDGYIQLCVIAKFLGDFDALGISGANAGIITDEFGRKRIAKIDTGKTFQFNDNPQNPRNCSALLLNNDITIKDLITNSKNQLLYTEIKQSPRLYQEYAGAIYKIAQLDAEKLQELLDHKYLKNGFGAMRSQDVQADVKQKIQNLQERIEVIKRDYKEEIAVGELLSNPVISLTELGRKAEELEKTYPDNNLIQLLKSGNLGSKTHYLDSSQIIKLLTARFEEEQLYKIQKKESKKSIISRLFGGSASSKKSLIAAENQLAEIFQKSLSKIFERASGFVFNKLHLEQIEKYCRENAFLDNIHGFTDVGGLREHLLSNNMAQEQEADLIRESSKPPPETSKTPVALKPSEPPKAAATPKIPPKTVKFSETPKIINNPTNSPLMDSSVLYEDIKRLDKAIDSSSINIQKCLVDKIHTKAKNSGLTFTLKSDIKTADGVRIMTWKHPQYEDPKYDVVYTIKDGIIDAGKNTKSNFMVVEPPKNKTSAGYMIVKDGEAYLKDPAHRFANQGLAIVGNVLDKLLKSNKAMNDNKHVGELSRGGIGHRQSV